MLRGGWGCYPAGAKWPGQRLRSGCAARQVGCAGHTSDVSARAGALAHAAQHPRKRSRRGVLSCGWVRGAGTGLAELLDCMAAVLNGGGCVPAQRQSAASLGAACAAAQPSTRQSDGASTSSNGQASLNGAQHFASSSSGLAVNGASLAGGLLHAPFEKPVLEAAGWAALAAGGATLPQTQHVLQQRLSAAPNRLRIFSGTSNPVRRPRKTNLGLALCTLLPACLLPAQRPLPDDTSVHHRGLHHRGCCQFA